MKQLLIACLCLLFATTGMAQTEKSESALAADSLSVPLTAPLPSLSAPSFNMYGITPFDYGFATWQLHRGLNASIGMHLTISPDKYMPSGAGFGQDAAFLYAMPLTSRLSVAGGIYASNMNWGFLKYRNVGVTGMAAYRLTDRVSIYAYGNKSLMPHRSLHAWPLPNFGEDRLGGMLNFKVGESSSISFGVEGRRNGYPY